MQKEFEKSAQIVKEKKIREQLIPVIRNIMERSRTKKDLESLLKKEKIQVVFRETNFKRNSVIWKMKIQYLKNLKKKKRRYGRQL